MILFLLDFAQEKFLLKKKKTLQKGEVTLSLTNIGKLCHPLDFFNMANMSFNPIAVTLYDIIQWQLAEASI